MTRSGEEPTKVLAVASGGGHWIELLRLRPAFEGHEVVYVTTDAGFAQDVQGHRVHVVRNASRWGKLSLALMLMQVFWVVLRERPHVVISTGAAPGYAAVRFGRWVGARTVWVDSIANVDELSLSGQMAGRCVDLWLTQWPHLASPQGPSFEGAVL